MTKAKDTNFMDKDFQSQRQSIQSINGDEIAYFTVRWKTRELVLSTAPKTWDNTDKDSKNRKRSH